MDYLHQVQREERLADKVSELLKKAIVSGQLQPGDRLPPERVLGERFGVSRTVIREAVRSLAAKGLVEVRSGSGSVVARVESGSVAEAMRLYVQGAAIDARLVHELRELLQVHAAGAAADRATEADVAALRGCLQHAAFHHAVAEAAHNPLLPLLLDALEAPPATADEPVDGHAPILERIAAHDRDGAREAMRRHLGGQQAVTGSQRA